MAFDLIQMPSKYLDNKEDQFSWRLLVFTLNSQNKQSAILGRHSTCDFLISAPKLPCFLSRKHAVLRINKNTLYVKDLKSTNGTFKNNVMLKPNVEYALRDGDLVAFGCKSEKRPSPGTTVNQNDTPFLFRVMKSKNNKTNEEKSLEKKIDSSGNTDADETSKAITSPSSNMQVSNDLVKNIQKQSSSVLSPPSDQPRKRKPSSSKSPKKNKKKVKLQGAAVSSAVSGEGADASDQCSSLECKALLYADDILNWVQCDACDKWFHTVCVGCNYDEVKDQEKFYCSFCNPADK